MEKYGFLPKEDFDFIVQLSADAQKTMLERIGMTEEEYHQLCQPYVEERQHYAELAKSFKEQYKKYKRIFEQIETTEKQGNGGLVVHRGYFLPSLILDIVVGGSNRGKLYKRHSNNPAFTFYFDIDNRLVAVRSYDMEFITYHGNTSIGVTYNETLGTLEAISECEYNEQGQIVKYVLARCDYKGKIDEYYKEIYTYTPDKMIVVSSDFNEDTIFKKGEITVNIHQYTFTVKDGYLTEYVTDMFCCEDLSNLPIDERTHPVRIKRKI